MTVTHLIVVGGSPDHRGGVEAYCERATSAIRRHRPDLACFWLPTHSYRLKPGGISRFARQLLRLWQSAGRQSTVWLNLSNLPDLCFAVVARAAGARLVLTTHLGANSRLQRQGPLRTLRLAGSRLAHHLLLLFDGQDLEIALPAGHSRSTVGTFLPEAALAPPALPARPGPLRLIHAGRLSPEKGSLRFIELYGALTVRGIAVQAMLIGRPDPGFDRQLTAAIAHHDPDGRIERRDWLDETALNAALRDADILVHLSELDSFPLIVLEAMAADTMPMVIDMAGVRTMLGDHPGYVARPDTPLDQLADWIAEQDPDTIRRDAAVAGVAVRLERGWAACVERLMTQDVVVASA